MKVKCDHRSNFHICLNWKNYCDDHISLSRGYVWSMKTLDPDYLAPKHFGRFRWFCFCLFFRRISFLLRSSLLLACVLVLAWLVKTRLNIETFEENQETIIEARFIRCISAVSSSVQRIKFGRNSTSESAAAFLPHIGLVLSQYPTGMRHRFKRRISAVSNSIQTLC